MSTLIKTYDIPDNVRKQASKYISLELYDDKMVGKGNKNGDITWFFKNYMTVQWTPANLGTQYATLVFVTHEGAGKILKSNLAKMHDINVIPFCSGMYSYKPANEYAKALCMDVKKVMDEYQAKVSEAASNNDSTIVQEATVAEQIRQLKDLVDEGILTQEEFDAKKKQLLGL